MIPKKIHYIWFGKKKKNKLIKKCIQSWSNLLPEWEIIEWNEDNYDVNSNKYMSEAYNAGRYAFAADYARFDILYKHGGIYLDTDVELLRPIPHEFLLDEGFTGVESNYLVNPGLIFGCNKKNGIVKEILDEYNKTSFIINGRENLKTVVLFTSDVLARHGFTPDNTEQCINNIRIYPMEYFCCYDSDVKEFYITDKAISVHRYANSWGSNKEKITLKVKMLVKRIIGVDRYRKLLKTKRDIKEIIKK